jgi:hypothetical protein
MSQHFSVEVNFVVRCEVCGQVLEEIEVGLIRIRVGKGKENCVSSRFKDIMEF